MEEQLEQSKRRLHFCMALIGGWFGAYMVLRFGHFASAATVNLLEMLTGAAQEKWPLALLRLRTTGSKHCCVWESLFCTFLRFFWQPACRNAVRAICGCGPFSQMQLRPVC